MINKQPDMKLEDIYNEIWGYLAAGASTSKSDFHLGFLSTISGNSPKQRTVVLRKCIPDKCELMIHTDARSGKVEDIEKNPNISLLFYSPAEKVQILVEGECEIHANDEIADKQWRQSRLFSKRCYLAQPSPGTKVDKPLSGLPRELIDRMPTEEETEEGRKNFCVLVVKAKRLEWLKLQSTGNARSEFLLNNIKKPQSGWIIP